MSTVTMYWQGFEDTPETSNGIVVDGDLIVPEDACGFRLEDPTTNGWRGAWYFAPGPGISGGVIEGGGIIWEAGDVTGYPYGFPEFIEARGPVHGCTSGSFHFNWPASYWGLRFSAAVDFGAGSFTAQFFDNRHLTWLNYAGRPIDIPDTPINEPPDLKLPFDVFDRSPYLQGCIRDTDSNIVLCPERGNTPEFPPSADFISTENKAPQRLRGQLLHNTISLAPPNGVIPGIKIIVPPTEKAATHPLGERIETDCPTECILTVIFYKNIRFEPARVKYRLRFAHGPVSTVFSKLLDENINTVIHSIPIPLPSQVGMRPGGFVNPRDNINTTMAGRRPTNDPNIPLIPRPDLTEPRIAHVPLPQNEYKVSMRVEVLNIIDTIVFSNWTTIHIKCTPESVRPKLFVGGGMRIPETGVFALQERLNLWLESQNMALLRIDNNFGPKTEAAVKAFQKAKHLEDDGIVEKKTWKQLLAL